jgi:hypothetical protein
MMKLYPIMQPMKNGLNCVKNGLSLVSDLNCNEQGILSLFASFSPKPQDPKAELEASKPTQA